MQRFPHSSCLWDSTNRFMTNAFSSRGIGKGAIHLAVYVDDLFISTFKRADIQLIESEMKQLFSDITFNYGLHHEYLGAHLDFSTPGEVTMSMESKIIELIKEHHISKTSSTPAANHLMEHRDLPLLPPDKQKMLREAVWRNCYFCQ
jgi:hypothetical protein